MAYNRIEITVKKPSKELEAFVRDIGVQKEERKKKLRELSGTEREIKVK